MLEETEDLVRIAKERSILLSESTVYLYHPQIDLIREYFQENKLFPKLITVLFSFPPLAENNFRYKKELGGGALLDTGPYIASVSRYFFNELPSACYYIDNSTGENKIEISYSIMMKYSDGRSLIGHLGFTTEYINRINILGAGICLDIDRIFTLPETVENTIKIKNNNQSVDIIAPTGNMFKQYFLKIKNCIETKEYDQLYTDMLMDAQTRNIITKCKEYGN